MHDLPQLQSVLDRAAIEAKSAPVYRFHGSVNPANRTPIPLMAAPDVAVKDGVATLRLYEPIDSWGGEWGVSAAEFARAVDSLDNTVTEIRLHINSPGGEVWQALAMLNTLRAHPARLVAIVDGIAASAASFIAVAADETVMGENSQMMIHDAAGLCWGNADEMHSCGALLDQVSGNIASIYAAKSGRTVDEIRVQMKAETWLTAQGAVDAGFADNVAMPMPIDEPVASAGSRDATVSTDAPPANANANATLVAYAQRRHRMNARKA
jgi:ATP-dependent protease ClpP protease subunit